MTVYDPSVGREGFVPQTVKFNQDFGLQSLFQSNGDLTDLVMKASSKRSSFKDDQVRKIPVPKSPDRFKRKASGNRSR